ncbi:hypothetical protein ACFX2I_014633 [Malus domestica]
MESGFRDSNVGCNFSESGLYLLTFGSGLCDSNKSESNNDKSRERMFFARFETSRRCDSGLASFDDVGNASRRSEQREENKDADEREREKIKTQ